MTGSGFIDEGEVGRAQSKLEAAAAAVGAAQGEVQRAQAQAQAASASSAQSYVADGRAGAQQALADAQIRLAAAEGEVRGLLGRIERAVAAGRSDASALEGLAGSGSAGGSGYAGALSARAQDVRKLEGFAARLRDLLARVARAGGGDSGGGGVLDALAGPVLGSLRRAAGPAYHRAPGNPYLSGRGGYASRGGYAGRTSIDSLLRSTPSGRSAGAAGPASTAYGASPAAYSTAIPGTYGTGVPGPSPLLGRGPAPGASWLEKLAAYSPLGTGARAAAGGGEYRTIGDLFGPGRAASGIEATVAGASKAAAPLAERAATAVKYVSSTLGRYIGSAVYGRNGLAGLLSRFKR